MRLKDVLIRQRGEINSLLREIDKWSAIYSQYSDEELARLQKEVGMRGGAALGGKKGQIAAFNDVLEARGLR